jgi:hypothetical protein
MVNHKEERAAGAAPDDYTLHRLQYLSDGEWCNLHLFYFRSDAEECGSHLPGAPRWRVVKEDDPDNG